MTPLAEAQTNVTTPSPASGNTTLEKTEEVVQLRVGEQKLLPFTELIRFSIRDTGMLQVKKIEGNNVTVFGNVTGETWIEVVHGQRQFTTLRVRIVPVEVEPTAVAIPSPVNPGTTPSPAPPTAEATSITPEIPNRLRQPDFAVSIDPVSGFDSQQATVVLADPSSGLLTSRTETFRSSFQVIPITLSYTPDRENRLMVQIPYVSRTQETFTAEGAKTTLSNQGLGDIRFGYEHTFPDSLFGWDTGIGLSAGLPTGKSPYDVGPSELPLGIGHTELGLNFIASRIFDPVSLRFSGGLDYTLPRTAFGQRISPGLGYNFDSTVAYALSDQWVLSEQLTFSRRPNVFLLNPVVPSIETVDQAYATHAISYSPNRDFLLRFLLSVGLNNASTDYIIGVSAQWSR